MQLVDEKKHVLYQQYVGKRLPKISLQFDMSDVGDGTYTLIINSDEGVFQKQVNVTTPRTDHIIAVN